MKWKQSTLPVQHEMFLQHGYGPFTAATLCKAGIQTLEEAREYLDGDELLNPARIRGIEQATEVIWKHIYDGSKICIFGDYDADGITAAAIMFLALKKLGANVTVRLPDRINEGYGISMKAIREQIELGVKLFVTVDNGVRAVAETALIKELGCDIVILDHHEPGDVLPEPDALIDLHISGETYPYVELTGSGLAWKVAHYMLEQVSEHDFAMSLVDIAAIGTIADVAPLHGENRVIVKRAIQTMRQSTYKRPGVQAILKNMSKVTAEDIAFGLAPCLNAPGRLSVQGAALSFIMLIEEDAQLAFELARKVAAENERRKTLQASCLAELQAEAERRIAAGDKVLVIAAQNAPSGIAGLLAGNLREVFGRPAIVFCPKTESDGKTYLTGSARSIEAFHILSALEACAQSLVRFGGHKQAAGLTMENDAQTLEQFRREINEYAAFLTEEDLDAPQFWDLELPLQALGDALYAEMETLEPFGAGAPKPTVKTTVSVAGEEGYRFMGANQQHLKLNAEGLSIVGFSLAKKYVEANLPEEIMVYGNLSYNTYRGETSKQLSMLDFEAIEDRGE